MFYCDECALKKNWPQSANPVNHVCEVCGKVTFCNDVPKEKIEEFQNKYDDNAWVGTLRRKYDGSHSMGTINPTDMWRSFMGPSGFAMPPGGMPGFQIRDKDLDDLLRMALNGALRGGGGPLFVGSFDNPEEAMQVCHEIIQIVKESPSPEIAMQRVIEYIQNRKGGAPSDQGTDSGDPYGGRYR